MKSFAEHIAILIVATQVKHLRGRRRRLEGGSGSSQVHLIYQTLYKISVARLDFAVNVFSQVLTVNGAVVLQRDLSEGAGLVHVVDR